MDPQLLSYLDLLGQGRANEADPELLRELCRRYPYFAAPATDLTDNLKAEGLSDEEIRMLKASILMQTGNPDTVSAALGLQSDADFYGETEHPREKMTTETTIDSFLERYGDSSNNDKELALLEKLIFNPVAPDYTSSLESLPTSADTTTSEKPASSSRHDELIDAFIAKNTQEASTADAPMDILPPADSSPQSSPSATPPAQPSESNESHQHALLTESLAKIYIKKGRYAKAFEIIHSLSLNYPEKSCYFADQLRFLHKLMLIQELQHKNKK